MVSTARDLRQLDGSTALGVRLVPPSAPVPGRKESAHGIVSGRGFSRAYRRMPIKQVEQCVPMGAVTPPLLRPPPPRPAPPVPAEDPVEYPSEDGIPMATSLKSLLQKSGGSRDLPYL